MAILRRLEVDRARKVEVADHEVKLSLNTSRLKTRNLQRNPRCSLLLLDLQNPYRYLEVRGTARLDPDDDYSFARKLGAKYDADLKVHDQPGESRVAVTPPGSCRTRTR